MVEGTVSSQTIDIFALGTRLKYRMMEIEFAE